MEQKLQFVSLAASGRFTISELCEQFGISRKTGHKWLRRYEGAGAAGLEDQSRAPKTAPGRTGADVERLIVAERRRHTTWGAKKIRQRLVTQHGIDPAPAVSTVGEVLKRNGLVKARRRRPGVFEVERGELTVPERPGHVLGVDFKGWFKTADGERFEPLTVTDLHSRYLLRAEGLAKASTGCTMRSFRAMFRRHGLPEIIRVDNGRPFASTGPGGLSTLSVWWIGLGISVEFTRRGCPQDNGSHERMHKTMKAECCSPSCNVKAQQRKMDRWRREFNFERPHESLGMRVPADVYRKSARRLDGRTKSDLYALGTDVRTVNGEGFISLGGSKSYVGEAFSGVDVALDPGNGGLVEVRFANIRLGALCGEGGTGRLLPIQPRD